MADPIAALQTALYTAAQTALGAVQLYEELAPHRAANGPDAFVTFGEFDGVESSHKLKRGQVIRVAFKVFSFSENDGKRDFAEAQGIAGILYDLLHQKPGNVVAAGWTIWDIQHERSEYGLEPDGQTRRAFVDYLFFMEEN